LSCFSFSRRAARSVSAECCSAVRFACLLVVLQRQVLILADLLHRGDLAHKSLGIGGHEETGSSIEVPVLELGKSDLTDLKLQPLRLFGLGLDVSRFNFNCARPVC
jgi:hypothetical protein